MRRTTIAAALIAFLLAPGSAGALTAEELRAQITALLTQIAALQLQVQSAATSTANATSTAATSSVPAITQGQGVSRTCPVFLRDLQRGYRGDDVLALQRYLVSNGLLESDSTTGFYGALTERAVQAWQAKFKIVSSGTPATTGYGLVGPNTRAAMKNACAHGLSFGLGASDPTATQEQNYCPLAPRPAVSCAGAWLPQVTDRGCTYAWRCEQSIGATTSPFRATPTSGFAPLTVSFTGTVQSAGFSINFGDGSATGDINCAHGACPLQATSTAFTVSHTYVMPGIYPVKLYAHGAVNAAQCNGADCNVVATTTVTVVSR